MLSIIKSKRFLMALLLSVFGFCISMLYNFVPLIGLDKESLEYLFTESSIEVFSVLITSGLFVFFITFICYCIGDYFKNILKLSSNKIDKKGFIIVLLFILLVPLLIGYIDFNTGDLEQFVSIYYTLVNTSTSLLYFGILQEIWLRFAFLPLIIYAFYKVFNKDKIEKEESVSKKYYILGLIFTTLFLFVFEMNKIGSLYSFNIIVIIRAILVYLIPNFIYGLLYLKYNIKVCALTHMLMIVIQLGIVPIVLPLILM